VPPGAILCSSKEETDMGDFECIEFNVEDPVAVIRLNRPEKLNAVTYEMLGEIRRAIDAAASDPNVVGIVITGNGRGFCAGLDSSALASTVARGRPVDSRASDDVPGMFTYFLAVPKPIIAAVNGVAAGGGIALALMSDVRFASREARFTTVFSKRGLISEHGTSWLLPRMLGPGRALDLLWTSRMVDAEEALKIGLVEFLTGPDDLVSEATAYIRRLADEVSPGSIAETKRLVYSHMGLGYPEALREAEVAQWAAVARADATEGARSLLERRAPTFERLSGAPQPAGGSRR
jgi:enoyl-CoA hydratase/carnithine racemase